MKLRHVRIKVITAGLLIVGSSLVLANDAAAPSVDATDATAQQAQASQQTAHHWYDGPLTGDSSLTQSKPVSVVSTEQALSDVTLPAVSDSQTGAGSTPTVAATQAVSLPAPPSQLPPVENLTTDNSSSSATSAGTASESYQGTKLAYNSTSSQWPTTTSTQQVNSGANAYVGSDSSSLQQQVGRLQQQLQNITAMNMPQQIADLQQQLQQISGQLAEEQHNLVQLKQQQSEFYKDLDQRIATMNGKTATSTTATDTVATSSTKVTTASSQGELTDVAEYQKASKLLASKQYDQAQVAYQQYLKDYPQGKFAANAHYWLGELYLVKKEQTEAAAEFNTVLAKFSQSTKVPDAEYKLALIKMDTGKTSDAKKEFKAIQSKFPNSTAAQLASIKLQQLAVTSGG